MQSLIAQRLKDKRPAAKNLVPASSAYPNNADNEKELSFYTHTLLLLQGTIWYSLFKYQPVLEIAQRLNYTAMGVGNHDFDDGKDGLIPFVKDVGFPVLASNLNLTLLPDLADVLPKSQIVSIGGYKVGIIGYITSDR